MSDDIEAMFTILKCFALAEFDRDPSQIERLESRLRSEMLEARMEPKPQRVQQLLHEFAVFLRSSRIPGHTEQDQPT